MRENPHGWEYGANIQLEIDLFGQYYIYMLRVLIVIRTLSLIYKKKLKKKLENIQQKMYFQG